MKVVSLEGHVSAGVVEVVRLEAVTLVVLGLLLTHCWSRPRHSAVASSQWPHLTAQPQGDGLQLRDAR